jgi:hypothetical protein
MHGRLVVQGKPEAPLCVSVAAHRRALLLIDALANALVARGHTVSAQRDPEGRVSVAFVVAGEALHASISERLDSKAHVLTPEERSVRNVETPTGSRSTTTRRRVSFAWPCMARGHATIEMTIRYSHLHRT